MDMHIDLNFKGYPSKKLFGTEAPKKKRIKAEEEDQKGIYWLFFKSLLLLQKRDTTNGNCLLQVNFLPFNSIYRLKSRNSILCIDYTIVL